MAGTIGLSLPMTTTDLFNCLPLILTILTAFVDPERFRSIIPPLYYLTLGMSAATILYLVLGMGIMSTISLSLVDAALSMRLSIPQLCVWFVLSNCLMEILDRYAGKPIFKMQDVLGAMHIVYASQPIFIMKGGRVRFMSEWLTQRAHAAVTNLQDLCLKTKRKAAQVWQRLKPKSNRDPHPVSETPGEREDRLRKWEDDLQEMKSYLQESEEELRAWDNRLRERDDNLRELEITLREWEDGLREALGSMKDQAEDLRESDEGMGDLCDSEEDFFVN